MYDFHQLSERNIRTSTAILNAARFPLASPPGIITNREGQTFGQILDGGYIDNFGSLTIKDVAVQVIERLQSQTDDPLEFVPVFIEISNDAYVKCRGDACASLPALSLRETPAPRIGFFDEFAAPLGGYRNANADAADTAPEAVVNYVNALVQSSRPEPTNENGKSDEADKSGEGKAEGDNRQENLTPIQTGSARYLQFRLCDVSDYDTPLGWAHSRSGYEVYSRSLATEESALSSRAIDDQDEAQCLCANEKAAKSLMCLLRDGADCTDENGLIDEAVSGASSACRFFPISDPKNGDGDQDTEPSSLDARSE